MYPHQQESRESFHKKVVYHSFLHLYFLLTVVNSLHACRLVFGIFGQSFVSVDKFVVQQKRIFHVCRYCFYMEFLGAFTGSSYLVTSLTSRKNKLQHYRPFALAEFAATLILASSLTLLRRLIYMYSNIDWGLWKLCDRLWEKQWRIQEICKGGSTLQCAHKCSKPHPLLVL